MARRVTGRRDLGVGLAVAVLATLAICAPTAFATAEIGEVEAYRQQFDVHPGIAEDYLEVQRKGTESDVVGDLEDRLGRNFAGVWFDAVSGEFVVPIVSEEGRAAVAEEFAAAQLPSDYGTRPVEYSWGELQATQGQLDGKLKEFFEASLIQTSLDPRTNAVVLHVASSAHEKERASLMRIVEDLGDRVELRESDAERFQLTLDACSDVVQNCSRPLRGGVEIAPPGLSYGFCTAGFRAEGDANSKRYVLSAGHCAAKENLFQWSAWDEQKLTTYGEPHPLGSVEQYSYPGHDWMKIDVTGSWWDVSPWPALVAYWQEYSVEPPINEEYPIYGESSSYINEVVCHSGASSGSSCGAVKALDVTANVGEPGGPLSYDLTKVKGACSASGDSGGPWFAANMALGLHVGSEDPFGNCPYPQEYVTYYQEITEATDALGVTIKPNIEEPPPLIPGEDDNFPGPHVAGQYDGTIDVFFREPDGELGHAWKGAAGGAGWATNTLGGSLASSSVPHPVLQDDGTIDLFWRTPSGVLGHAWKGAGGGSAWATNTLGGSLASDPHAVVQDDGTIDVFWRTPSNVLGHAWKGAGGGAAWATNTLGGSLAADPYPVLQDDGTIDVFWRTPSNVLGHAWKGAGGGAGWATNTLGGSLASDPHAVVQDDGTIDVFWRTPTSVLGHAWKGAGGGSAWATNTLGGSLAADPYPVLQDDGTIDVFWRTPTSVLGHAWKGAGGGAGWATNTLGGSVTTTPHATAHPNGTIDVFWRTESGVLGHAWKGAGGGSAWATNTLGGSLSL